MPARRAGGSKVSRACICTPPEPPGARMTRPAPHPTHAVSAVTTTRLSPGRALSPHRASTSRPPAPARGPLKERGGSRGGERGQVGGGATVGAPGDGERGDAQGVPPE